jgi:hypothetical protein
MDYDETLARMRAEMMSQGRQPQVYDDGASLLGQDPNMLQVGLFGKRPPVVPPPVVAEPPINLARRSILGLRPTSNENLPAVRPQDIPPPASAPVPVPVPTAQAPTPDLGSFDFGKGNYDAPSAIGALGALVNKAAATPMSRREVLQRAGQAALNHALPVSPMSEVAKQITAEPSALSHAVEAVKPMFTNDPGINSILSSAVATAFDQAYMSEPEVTGITGYEYLRDKVGNRISDRDWSVMDKFYKRSQRDYDNGIRNNITLDANHKLFEFFDHNKDKLSPTELQEMHSMLTQSDDLNYLLSDAQALDPSILLSEKELADYLDAHHAAQVQSSNANK